VIPQAAHLFEPFVGSIPGGAAPWFLGFGAAYVLGWLLSAFGQFWQPWEKKDSTNMLDAGREALFVELLDSVRKIQAAGTLTDASRSRLRELLEQHKGTRTDYWIVRYLDPVAGARLLKLRAEIHMLKSLKIAFLFSTLLTVSRMFSTRDCSVCCFTSDQTPALWFLLACVVSWRLSFWLSVQMNWQCSNSSRQSLWLNICLPRPAEKEIGLPVRHDNGETTSSDGE
jgi:hypothetical protein